MHPPPAIFNFECIITNDTNNPLSHFCVQDEYITMQHMDTSELEAKINISDTNDIHH